MAITENTYTGDGVTVLFSFTFPYLVESDIKASLDGTPTTAYTLANATTIQFNTAPANGVVIRIYRDTNVDDLPSTFFPGSAIKAEDLNNNFTQNNYSAQESKAAASQAPTALDNSLAAVTTANQASADASAALTAASNAVAYSPVADVASIPVSPTDGDYIEVFDGTGIESFTPLAGLPVGFVGDSGLSIRLNYTSAGSTWNWVDYIANDADTRYIKSTDIGVTVQAYDVNTAKYDDTTANFTGTLQNGGSNVVVDSDIGATVQAYDANALSSSDIGVSVQAYDADTAKLDVSQTFTGSQTFDAGVVYNNNVTFSTNSGAANIDGDVMGTLLFNGYDGSVFRTGASIVSSVDDPTANSVSGDLLFSVTQSGETTPTPRYRIDNAGAHSMTGKESVLFSSTEAAAGTSYIVFVGRHSSTGINSGTNSCFIYSNGNIYNTNNVYSVISDVSLKENIVDANSQWLDIKNLQVRNFNFKASTGHQTNTQIGFIAQEVEQVSPGLVEEINTGDATIKGVKTSVLLVKAVKALQEAMEKIDQLQSRLDAAGL